MGHLDSQDQALPPAGCAQHLHAGCAQLSTQAESAQCDEARWGLAWIDARCQDRQEARLLRRKCSPAQRKANTLACRAETWELCGKRQAWLAVESGAVRVRHRRCGRGSAMAGFRM